ncbi:ankyrin repeat domain-containing protein 50 [Aspergillus lentulus]|nr:ankyrin repeat domain-containing protein 50 [Aspergillus lentulus]
MAVLPPEILHDILGHTTPSWRWGWRWKKWRKTMLARADLLWFLNLRLVNKQFDDIVIDHFHTAVRAGLIDRKLPICDGAPNPSTMAMARRLLCSLVERSRLQGEATRSVYPLVDTINAGVDGVVEFFSHRSDVDIEELRSRYLSGMIAMFVGLAGTNFIGRVLAPAGAGGETMDDGLDDEREEWSCTALMAAAYLGRTDDMEHLLAWRIKNTADPDKSLHGPLMTAAFGGQGDSVRFLIDRGVDINTRTTRNGDTAVHFAALGGHASLVEYLLEAGADADVVNNAGDTPLLWAARGGHADVVRELLKTGEVDVNFRDRLRRAPLIWAAARGFDNVVKELLLREEIDVNIMDGVVNLLAGPIYHAGSAGVPGGSPLEVAAMIGREDVFQRLYRHPQAYRELSTVFPRALTGGKASIVRTIIQAFPNTLEDYESSYEETAFLRAAEDSSEEVVRYLLSLNKTPINYQDRDGKTALYFAVKSGDLGKVTALLEHPDVDVNLRTDELSGCQSLLHCAVNQRCVDPEVMKALLARPDINVNARDYGGMTPLAYAAFNGQAELVKLLLQRHDVDLFPLDRFGDTPLLLAAKEGESHIVNILLKVPGTDIWHRNNWDKTALGLAGESGHAEVVRRLLDPGFKVAREIICDAIENTKEALVAIRRTPTSFLGSENERLAQERRIEEAYKLLSAGLDRIGS